MFPAAVQEEIFVDMHRHAVKRVPMFQCSGCDESFFATIVRLLRVNVLLEGDFVFRQGEVGDRMYFIKTGYLQIGTADRSVVFASKGPGTYLGELTMFNPGQRRNASSWSLSDCILFTLEITDFYAVLQRYDKDNSLYNEMKHISVAQSQKQSKINRKSTSIRDDRQSQDESTNKEPIARPSCIARASRFAPPRNSRVVDIGCSSTEKHEMTTSSGGASPPFPRGYNQRDRVAPSDPDDAGKDEADQQRRSVRRVSLTVASVRSSLGRLSHRNRVAEQPQS